MAPSKAEAVTFESLQKTSRKIPLNQTAGFSVIVIMDSPKQKGQVLEEEFPV